MLLPGVRVARGQAGPLQAMLFSDTVARIRAFQKRQLRQQHLEQEQQQQAVGYHTHHNPDEAVGVAPGQVLLLPAPPPSASMRARHQHSHAQGVYGSAASNVVGGRGAARGGPAPQVGSGLRYRHRGVADESLERKTFIDLNLPVLRSGWLLCILYAQRTWAGSVTRHGIVRLPRNPSPPHPDTDPGPPGARSPSCALPVVLIPANLPCPPFLDHRP